MSRQDLWRLTTGEILDLIQGFQYKQYLASRQNAELAFFVAAAFSGKIRRVEELCGKWIDGKVMTLAEANNYYTELAKKKR